MQYKRFFINLNKQKENIIAFFKKNYLFLRAVFFRFYEDNGLSKAASLSYTTIISLVPIFTVGLALFASFEFLQARKSDIVEKIAINFGGDIAKEVFLYLEKLSEKATGIGIIGVLILFFSASAILRTLETTYNEIWRVKNKRPFLDKIKDFTIIILLGPILLSAGMIMSAKITTIATKYLSPYVPIQYEWEKNILYASPKVALKPNIKYHLIIKGNIKDVDGIPLGENYTVEFKTKSYDDIRQEKPTVISISPSNNSVDVPIFTTIEVIFSKPMNHESVEEAFKLVDSVGNEVKGSFFWIGKKMIFLPSLGENLSKATKYDIIISHKAKDIAGFPLEDFRASFITSGKIDDTPPKVINVFPKENAQQVPIKTEIYIEFSKVMNRTITQKAISITSAIGEEIKGSWFWEPKRLLFKPIKPLLKATEYKITVSKFAKDIFGNPLQTDFVSYFFTASEKNTTPPNIIRIEGISPNSDITITPLFKIIFSKQMDKTSFEKDSIYIYDTSRDTPIYMLFGILFKLAEFIGPLTFSWLILFFLYVYMPYTYVSRKAAAKSALIIGIVWEFSKLGFLQYATHLATTTTAIYGQIAAFPLFLSWIYISWAINIYGAELTYIFQYKEEYTQTTKTSPIDYIYYPYIAIAIMYICAKNFIQKKGEVKYKEIRKTLPFKEEIKREIIQKLESAKLLSYIPTKNSLLIATPPSEITLKNIIDVAIGSSSLQIPSFIRDEISEKLQPISEKLKEKEEEILSQITLLSLIDSSS
jgi:membrane protein